MWIPRTEDEIVQAVRSRSIEETATFDAKREIDGKNTEIAKDLAAMANEGGVILYGLAEDENGRPALLNPIPLADQPERIAMIARTSVSEPLEVSITTILTQSDPSCGYIAVLVPASARAPHMVVVKGNHRYYGRTDKGNEPLSEGQVALLYDRRRRWEVDREALLRQEIEAAPVGPQHGLAYLHLFAQPIGQSEDFLERAVGRGQPARVALSGLVKAVSDAELFPTQYYPDFSSSAPWRFVAEGFECWMSVHERPDDPKSAASMLRLRADGNGACHLFCGRAGELQNQEPGYFWFFPEIAAGNTTRFLAFVGELTERASWCGMVDMGLAITGLRGSVPHSTNPLAVMSLVPYGQDEYRRTSRVLSAVPKEDPRRVAKTLLMPLLNAMSQGRVDPFIR